MMIDQASLCVAASGLAVLLSAPLRKLYRKRDKARKTVLVTGSASGIGRAIALELIARGDFVVGTDISDQGLKDIEMQFPQSFLPLHMNVADSKSVQQAAKDLSAKLGAQCIDAVVNNAGIMKGGPLTEMPDSAMEASLQVNVLGMFYVCKYFFPLLKRNVSATTYRPRFINMGSEVSYSYTAAAMNAPYAISKFSVEALSQSLRQEMLMLHCSPHVVVINPGAHQTGMTQRGNAHVGEIIQGSNFTKQLTVGNQMAQDYMDRHALPAVGVAVAVADAVHLLYPPYRIWVNMSLEMLAMKYLPQTLLDFAVGLIFGKNKQ